MIKKILVPLDGSKLAECVLPFVLDIAPGLGAEVILVTVTNRTQGFWPFEDASQPKEIRLEPQAVCSMEEQAGQYLNTAAKSLEDKGVKVSKEVICGKTAQEIIFYAKDNQCDLIVISTHGRSGLGKITHGSITAKILQSAPVPVAVIRPPR
jgi:nucleotide-binding universal stress UspA family protein